MVGACLKGVRKREVREGRREGGRDGGGGWRERERIRITGRIILAR